MSIVDQACKKLKDEYKINSLDIVVVVGSGLIASVPKLQNEIRIDYESLGLPKSRVKGHVGAIIYGTYNGKKVAYISRMHYYESGDIKKVRLPLEMVKALGAKTVIVLTASGGINRSYAVGDLMLIQDHINMSGVNPLVAIDDLSFTSMTNCYDKGLRKIFKEIARSENIDIKEGVFSQMSGPSYETRAEIEMLRIIGADSVSMSTAHDCIIANYLNMKVLGVSVIVNMCGGEAKLTHKEVLTNAAKACEKLKKLISEFLKKI